ncbi:DUF3857 domain-containing protein [Christiangramia salexigens]|uniref:DUF3857 domain-containing protein n=1 Tax=Christiangramia salexigens TaxID=1913577 RepID=A0A1L3J1K9_9FLAO|nr:DUF3857 domain-containing protein [Christiangramia salexigens]APG58998.1 hypothetical protein LPB144_00635 [Christiangramia salexigens]
MNKLSLFIALMLITQGAHSQNYNQQTLTPSIADLESTGYPADSTAHAFYIFEKGFTEIDKKRDYDLVHSYEAKIKILDKEGIEEANITIPLRKSSKTSSKESIENLKAHTYKLINGRIVKKSLSLHNIYIDDYETYDLMKFTLPDVEQGDVIVYSYELISPFLFDFTTWYFQEDIPKLYSEFTAKIPGNYEYYTTLVGELKLSTDETKLIKKCMTFGSSTYAGCAESKYAMKNIPAFKEEDYMISEKNFKSRISYELKQITRVDGFVQKYTKTWEDVEKELKTSKGLGKQWKRDGLVDDLLPSEIRELPNTIDKAKEIYRFVQDNYNWNEKYQIHREMNLRDLLNDKTGNVLAINTLLHNLYDSEGFEVYPVMASTRNHGLISKLHPVLSDFNYFFVQLNLDEDEYFLDATEKNLDFGRLPLRSLNHYARKIDFNNGSSWIDITPKDFSNTTFRDSLKIKPDGTSTGYSEQLLTGYNALRFRDYMKDYSKDEIFHKVAKPNSHTAASDLSFENVDEIGEPLKIRFDLENQSQKIGNTIYFNPFSFKFFKENPFKLKERYYPIDFGYKDVYFYLGIIELPEGYNLVELPEKKALRMAEGGGSLFFDAIKTSDNVINIQCRLTFPKTVYSSVYYDALKRFFEEIILVQSQSLIVLKENT